MPQQSVHERRRLASGCRLWRLDMRTGNTAIVTEKDSPAGGNDAGQHDICSSLGINFNHTRCCPLNISCRPDLAGGNVSAAPTSLSIRRKVPTVEYAECSLSSNSSASARYMRPRKFTELQLCTQARKRSGTHSCPVDLSMLGRPIVAIVI